MIVLVRSFVGWLVVVGVAVGVRGSPILSHFHWIAGHLDTVALPLGCISRKITLQWKQPTTSATSQHGTHAYMSMLAATKSPAELLAADMLLQVGRI